MRLRHAVAAVLGLAPLAAGAASITPLTAANLAETTASPHTSAAYTPTSGRLQFVLAQGSGTTQATCTVTNSQSLTFTQVAKFDQGGAANSAYVFVADDPTSSTSSQTVTFDCASDATTGGIVFVGEISGMSKSGFDGSSDDAIAQTSAARNSVNTGSDDTPDVTFSGSVDTNNPTILFVANASNPATLTAPTSWTEGGDLGYASPTQGAQYSYRDSGFTGTNIAMTVASGSNWGAIGIEFDASAAETAPAFDSAPSCSALDADTMRCSADADANALTIKWCVRKKDDTTSADGAAVEACSSGVTSGSVAATGSSQNIDIDISGDQFPIYDYEFAAKATTLYSSVSTQLDEVFPAPSGEQYVVKSGSPGGGETGLFDGASPATADGDYLHAVAACDSFANGADYSALTLEQDTTFVVATGGDLSRQLCGRRFYDVSVKEWSDASLIAYAINNLVPIYIDETYFLVTRAEPVNIVGDSLWLDLEGDSMTHVFGNVPAGGSANSEAITGSFTTCGLYNDVEATATDQYSGAGTLRVLTIDVGMEVPDVVNDDEATAIAAIEANSCLNAVAGTPRYSATVTLGNVIETSSEAGELLGYNSNVTYVLSLGPPPASQRKKLNLGLGIDFSVVFEPAHAVNDDFWQRKIAA